MGKSTISMAIFNSYVSLPEGIRIRLPMLDIPTWGCIPLINGSEKTSWINGFHNIYPHLYIGMKYRLHHGIITIYKPHVTHV